MKPNVWIISTIFFLFTTLMTGFLAQKAHHQCDRAIRVAFEILALVQREGDGTERNLEMAVGEINTFDFDGIPEGVILRMD